MYKWNAISSLWSVKHEKELLVKRKLGRLKLTNEKQKCRLRNERIDNNSIVNLMAIATLRKENNNEQ